MRDLSSSTFLGRSSQLWKGREAERERWPRGPQTPIKHGHLVSKRNEGSVSSSKMRPNDPTNFYCQIALFVSLTLSLHPRGSASPPGGSFTFHGRSARLPLKLINWRTHTGTTTTTYSCKSFELPSSAKSDSPSVSLKIGTDKVKITLYSLSLYFLVPNKILSIRCGALTVLKRTRVLLFSS